MMQRRKPLVVPEERRVAGRLTLRGLMPGLRSSPGGTTLTVVGDTGVDLYVRVDDLPERDGKAIGRHLGIYGGGMSANFAAAAVAAAPGIAVSLVSSVGGDEFGRWCIEDLNAFGVDTSRVVTHADSATWWCAAALDASGEKALLGGRTRASLPTAADVPPQAWSPGGWLHVLGDVEFSLDAVRDAHADGVGTSVDIEGSFAKAEPERARALIEAADLCVLNLSALDALLPDEPDPLPAVVSLLQRRRVGRMRAALVTLGADGSLFAYADQDGRWHAERFSAIRVPVIDSTGAGDAYAGTFIGRLLAGGGVVESAENAARAASRALTHIGARGRRLDPRSPAEKKD